MDPEAARLMPTGRGRCFDKQTLESRSLTSQVLRRDNTISRCWTRQPYATVTAELRQTVIQSVCRQSTALDLLCRYLPVQFMRVTARVPYSLDTQGSMTAWLLLMLREDLGSWGTK